MNTPRHKSVLLAFVAALSLSACASFPQGEQGKTWHYREAYCPVAKTIRMKAVQGPGSTEYLVHKSFEEESRSDVFRP